MRFKVKLRQILRSVSLIDKMILFFLIVCWILFHASTRVAWVEFREWILNVYTFSPTQFAHIPDYTVKKTSLMFAKLFEAFDMQWKLVDVVTFHDNFARHFLCFRYLSIAPLRGRWILELFYCAIFSEVTASLRWLANGFHRTERYKKRFRAKVLEGDPMWTSCAWKWG